MNQIQVKNLRGVTNMMNRLPKNIQKEVGENAILDLARNLQRRMRNRAPIGSGWLRKSIMVEKNGKIVKVIVHAYYGMAVEEGSKEHVVPEAYFGFHKTMPDAPGQYIKGYKGPYVMVGGAGSKHPFVRPALKSLEPKIPTILIKYVEKAINKSKQK